MLARFRVMLGEAAESVRLIGEFLDAGTAADRAPLPVPGWGRRQSGLGWAESPRGEALAWVALDERRPDQPGPAAPGVGAELARLRRRMPVAERVHRHPDHRGQLLADGGRDRAR